MGPAAGKTALACGLASHWAAQGRTVGYAALGAAAEDHARFMGAALQLPEGSIASASTAAGLALPAADVVVVEVDDATPVAEAARALRAKVLLAVRYRQHLCASEVAGGTGDHRDLLAGVVVNGVPPRVVPPLRGSMAPALEAAGLPLLGVVPEERALMGFTVGELADHLGASFLCREDRRDVLVQALMLGANTADPAFGNFQAKPNTALICRANRPDLQLTALEQAMVCMVFTGEGPVQRSVVYRAEDAGVPILAVADDTIGAVRRLEGLVERVRFRQTAKVEVMANLLDGRLDWGKLERALGLR